MLNTISAVSSPSRVVHLCARRWLTSGEIASALRPFYFAVHPDFFTLHPKMRQTNERSIQRLNAHFDTMKDGKMVEPTKLRFYVRNRNDSREFKEVDVQLKGDDRRLILLDVLMSCDLPIDHVPKAVEKAEPKVVQRTTRRRSPEVHDDSRIAIFLRKRKAEIREKRSLATKDLRQCAANLSAQAAENRSKFEILQKTLAADIAEICEQTGLLDIRWESQWNLNYCKIALNVLKRTMGLSSGVQRKFHSFKLNNRIIVLANRGTYVNFNREICIGVDDPQEIWMALLWRTQTGFYANSDSEFDAVLAEISERLGGLCVTAPRDTPRGEYAKRLNTFARNVRLADKEHPIEMLTEGVRLILDCESASNALLQNGYLRVAANIALPHLVEFLKLSVPQAKSRQLYYSQTSKLVFACAAQISELCNFKFVEFDESLDISDVLDSQERLVAVLESNSDMCSILSNFSGVYFSRSESIRLLYDGKLSLPLDWCL